MEIKIREEGIMKIRNIMTGEVLDVELRTDHAASSYG